MRTIAIGDIHGCLDELEEMLGRLQPTSEDSIWLLGDLVDRGPDSSGVVEYVMKYAFNLVKGNHDDKHARYRRHIRRHLVDPSYVVPMHPSEEFLRVHWALSDDGLDWITGAPAIAEIQGGWLLVHAGLLNHENPNTPSKPMNLRFLDRDTGKAIRMEERLAAPDKAIHWSERWRGPCRVIYGHHAQPEVVRSDFAFGIDTGLVYGGHLTAAIIDHSSPDDVPRFVQVRARTTYCQSSNWEGED